MIKLIESVNGEGIEIMRADYTAKLKMHTNGISGKYFTSWIHNSVTAITSKHDTLTRCWINFSHRLRRWANIDTALRERVVFAGNN